MIADRWTYQAGSIVHAEPCVSKQQLALSGLAATYFLSTFLTKVRDMAAFTCGTLE
jgi:hypothetical protein